MKYYERIIDNYLKEDVRSSGSFDYDEVVDLMRALNRQKKWLFIGLMVFCLTTGYLIGCLTG